MKGYSLRDQEDLDFPEEFNLQERTIIIYLFKFSRTETTSVRKVVSQDVLMRLTYIFFFIYFLALEKPYSMSRFG